jgi:hypothetical protein
VDRRTLIQTNTGRLQASEYRQLAGSTANGSCRHSINRTHWPVRLSFNGNANPLTPQTP